MKLAFVSLPIVLLVGAAACSSSSSPSPFNGAWSCKTTSTLDVTEPTSTTETTSNTSTLDISIDDNGTLTILTGGVDGGTVGANGQGCTITYDTTGPNGTLVSGQTCPVSFGSSSFTAKVTISYATGSATVSASTLTYTIAGSFKGTAMGSGGAATINLDGTGSITATCTK